MESEGVISNYLTLMSLSKLGLGHYKIYFQLHGFSKKELDSIINDFISYYKINWVARSVGVFDLIISVLCKDLKEFNIEKNNILKKYNKYISSYHVGLMAETYVYGKKYLVDDDYISLEDKKMISGESTLSLDDVDKQILSLLSNNSRIASIDISRKLNLNIKTVILRIKELEKKIINGYDIFFDFNKINYKYYKLFISINKFTQKDYDSFLGYCKNNKNIIYLVENIGSWELEPEIEIDSEEKFYDIVDDIKNKFPDFIKKIDVVKIIKDYKHIYVTKEMLDTI
ncbi:MAG: Lrp/AsnC family transcriptional regulator, partial [Candidatus Nanoarchaeia archaeon]|nr:Lrp/AsnC family transcriptional regulator [Candidatus Nanoarchaeia archaeon]